MSEPHQTTPRTNGLVKKLAVISGKLERVPKRGRNEFHKYDYVMEADLADAVRKELSEAGIMMIPAVLPDSVSWRPLTDAEGKPKGLVYYADFSFTFTDGADSVVVLAPGCGHDNPGDKGPYKAFTGAEKYALMKLFLIPTGDDPEDDSGTDNEKKSAPVGGSSGDHRPSAPAASRPAGGEHTVPFGKSKGKKVSELDDAGLAWYTKVCEESVAKNDEKWHAKNVQALEACKAEWAKRQPWRFVWNELVKFGAKHSLGEAGLIDTIKEATGKATAKELVGEDLEVVKNFIEEMERNVGG